MNQIVRVLVLAGFVVGSGFALLGPGASLIPQGGNETGPPAAYALPLAVLPPVVSNLQVTSPRDEGATVTLTGDLFDPDGEDIRLDINWDEKSGGPTETFFFPEGTSGFTAEFVYKDDNPTGTPQDLRTITVTASNGPPCDCDGNNGNQNGNADGDSNIGPSTTDTENIIVKNVPPEIENLNADSPISAGKKTTLTGTIDDPGTKDTFTVNVNWGDGNSSNKNVGSGNPSFKLKHKYKNSGNFQVTVTVTDDDTGLDVEQTNVNVI